MREKGYVLNQLNKNYFPFRILSLLFSITAAAIIIIKLSGVEEGYMWAAGGAELLFYMLINASCSMVVIKLGLYLKQTILAYIINLVLLTSLIILLQLHTFRQHSEYFTVYEALVFCFFTTLFLILLIRQVIGYLKD